LSVRGFTNSVGVLLLGALIAFALLRSGELPTTTGSVSDLPVIATAPVERRSLSAKVVMRVQPVVEIREVTLPDGLGGVVTDLELRPGSEVGNGHHLFSLDGRPVFAVEARFPFYREIHYRDRGDDVTQLQQILVADGESLEVDGVFGPATQRALEGYYRRRGFEVPRGEGGGPEELRVLRSEIAAAEAALETSRSTLDALRAEQPADTASIARAEADLRGAEMAAAEARTRLAESLLKSGAILRPGEFWVRLGWNDRPAKVVVKVGDRVTPGTVLWETGNGVSRFKAMVDRGTFELLMTGDRATIEDLPGVGELEAIVEDPVRAVADGNGTDSDLVPVMLQARQTVDLELEAGRTYRAVVKAESTSGEVLVVPLAALTDGRESEVAVTVVGPDDRRGERSRLVDVTTGVSAGGFVEVAPLVDGDLIPGDLVVVGLFGGGPGEGG